MAEQNVEQATKLCTNCKKPINLPTYELHVMHCHRRIQLCPKCNEPYPKADLQQHIDEIHHDVKCDWCSSAIDASKLEAHKQSCSKRPEECPYCHLDIASDELGGHTDVCGTRTEQCERCGTYVKLMDFEDHDEEQCNRRMVQKIRKDTEDHEKSYAAALSVVKQPTLQLGSGWSAQRPSLNGYDLTDYRSAPSTSLVGARPRPSYTSDEPHRSASREREERERKQTEQQPTTVPKRRENSVEKRGKPGGKEQAQPEVDPDSIPCEFCNVPFPRDIYLDHAQYCYRKENRIQYDCTDVKSADNQETYDCQADRPIADSDDGVASFARKDEEDLSDSSNVMAHKCTEAVNGDSWSGLKPAAPKVKCNKHAESSAAANHRELISMIPCGNCNNLIPSPEFIKHQAECERSKPQDCFRFVAASQNLKVHLEQRGSRRFGHVELGTGKDCTSVCIAHDEATQQSTLRFCNSEGQAAISFSLAKGQNRGHDFK